MGMLGDKNMSTAKRLQLGLTWRVYAVGAFYALAQIAVLSALGVQPLLAQEPGKTMPNQQLRFANPTTYFNT